MESDDDEFKTLEKMIACAVQFPHLNRQWSLLISSDEGMGKGLFYEVIMKLVGKTNCVSLRLPHIYNNFNSQEDFKKWIEEIWVQKDAEIEKLKL